MFGYDARSAQRAVGVGAVFSVGDNELVPTLLETPDSYFGGFGWIYWLVCFMTIMIPTIVIAKKESAISGIWTFLATNTANATALISAYMFSNFLLPIIQHFSPPSSIKIGEKLDLGILGNMDGEGIDYPHLGHIFQQISNYVPHIIIGSVLLSSFIFVIARHCEEGIAATDILRSFFCSLIVPLAVLVAIAFVVFVVWGIGAVFEVVLFVAFQLIILVAVILALPSIFIAATRENR